MSFLLQTSELIVSDSNSPLGFETTGGGSWPVWHRYLTLDGKHAYELGNICSTCSFFFERMEGANQKVEVSELTDRLANGLTSIEPDMAQTLGKMMPSGAYDLHFLELTPIAVSLGRENDYFVTEQQAVWGLDGFWGLPHDPRVPYYRTGSRAISKTQRLFEFVIPMYPRTWLNQDRVETYRASLKAGAKPTAISVSILDVKAPATGDAEEFEHWCLAHYVLDGHHKLEAAAQTGKRMTMVSFVARTAGISDPEQVEQLRSLLNFHE